jgi:hypothetical protein
MIFFRELEIRPIIDFTLQGKITLFTNRFERDLGNS